MYTCNLERVQFHTLSYLLYHIYRNIAFMYAEGIYFRPIRSHLTAWTHLREVWAHTSYLSFHS
jgi:hypothetical protein